MTSEAADEDVDPNTASPDLVALVAKREQELRGTPPAPGASEAGKAKETGAGAEAGMSDAGQAEEVEAEGKKAAGDPEKGKSEEAGKALDVEWAKSDTLKRRLSTLHEAGHLDEELIDLIRTGVERKEHLRAANKRFEDAAEKVKAANQERDQYRERAERFDRLMADPKFHAAAHAVEGNGEQTEPEDPDLMTPAQKREWVRREARREIEAEKQAQAKTAEQQKAWLSNLTALAEEHKASFNGTVSDEDYEAALKAMLSEMYDEGQNPREVLTEKMLISRVNRVLERQREEKDVQGLRERVEGTKRDAVRSARASSPPGTRTEVERTYASPREKRIAETLAKYPLRPE